MTPVEQLWHENPLFTLCLVLLIVQWLYVVWLRLRLRYVQHKLTKAQSKQTTNSLNLPSIERVIEKISENLRNAASRASTSLKRGDFSAH